ncbi:MAG TPA: hypothetical protein VF794_33120 [Archangium sp.]|uniref:hypothetical protein n=1 Tax=Archangium sp. TaxID=1872627 RepID=UPI002ED89746
MSTRLVGLGVLVVAVLLQAACATGAPTRYSQTVNSAVDGCLRNPACVASSPGEEAIIPWLSRAMSAARTVATLKELLEEAELRRIEKILIECAQEADTNINERDYGPGIKPDIVLHVARDPSKVQCVSGILWRIET